MVQTRGVREAALKQVVVASRDAFQDVTQCVPFSVIELANARHAAATEYYDFEGPDGPERNQRDEMIVVADDSLGAWCDAATPAPILQSTG